MLRPIILFTALAKYYVLALPACTEPCISGPFKDSPQELYRAMCQSNQNYADFLVCIRERCGSNDTLVVESHILKTCDDMAKTRSGSLSLPSLPSEATSTSSASATTSQMVTSTSSDPATASMTSSDSTFLASSAPDQSRKLPAGLIVGIAVGFAATTLFFAGLLALIWHCRIRAKKGKDARLEFLVSPFVSSSEQQYERVSTGMGTPVLSVGCHSRSNLSSSSSSTLSSHASASCAHLKVKPRPLSLSNPSDNPGPPPYTP